MKKLFTISWILAFLSFLPLGAAREYVKDYFNEFGQRIQIFSEGSMGVKFIEGKSDLYRAVEAYNYQQAMQVLYQFRIECKTSHKTIMTGYLDDGNLPVEKVALQLWLSPDDKKIIAMMQALLDAQGGINARLNDGETLLHRAVKCGGNKLVLVYLDKFNADPNVRNASWELPLDCVNYHYEAFADLERNMREILERFGAKPSVK